MTCAIPTVLLNDIDSSITIVLEYILKWKLKLRLKDLLEENVDEKYYLSSKTIQQISSNKSFNLNSKFSHFGKL